MELVLNTFGTALIKENGNLVVVHNDGKQIIPIDNLKTILISKGAKISSDAALLAIDNEVEILFVDGTGKPQGRLWSIKYGSVSTIRRKQLDFTFSKSAVEWIKQLLVQKIDNQVALLFSVAPMEWEHQKMLDKTINRLNDYKTKITGSQGENISEIAPTLRGWEGAASRNYFTVISMLLPEQYKFEKRTQHPATDIFNAVLNYGYGMLYGKVEGALIKAGLDPYVGVMHREDYNRPVLVFDVIEKFRIWIDYVVIRLLMESAINEDCVSIKSDGSYWLEALGKRILIQSVNDYLDEIIPLNGLHRSRATHIDLYARDLAQKILKLKI